jgi:hypothetical protein
MPENERKLSHNEIQIMIGRQKDSLTQMQPGMCNHLIMVRVTSVVYYDSAGGFASHAMVWYGIIFSNVRVSKPTLKCKLTDVNTREGISLGTGKEINYTASNTDSSDFYYNHRYTI